jgi:hypothetical protein
MNSNSNSRLKEIHDEVSILTFSEDNFLDIINYIEEAIRITKNENPCGRAKFILNQFRQTKEKQLDFMKANYGKSEDREDNFNTLKFDFLADLGFCY